MKYAQVQALRAGTPIVASVFIYNSFIDFSSAYEDYKNFIRVPALTTSSYSENKQGETALKKVGLLIIEGKRLPLDGRRIIARN